MRTRSQANRPHSAPAVRRHSPFETCFKAWKVPKIRRFLEVYCKEPVRGKNKAQLVAMGVKLMQENEERLLETLIFYDQYISD